jgi:hypothetical protein
MTALIANRTGSIRARALPSDDSTIVRSKIITRSRSVSSAVANRNDLADSFRSVFGPSMRRDRPAPRPGASDCPLANDALFYPLPRVADLLDRLLHGRGRPSGLLRFVSDFVLLPAGHPRPVLFASASRLRLSWSKPEEVPCPLARAMC